MDIPIISGLIGIAAGGLATTVIVKLAPKFFGKWLGKGLADLLKLKGITDPFIHERLECAALDFILVAEYVLPDDGLGEQKKALIKKQTDKMGFIGKIIYELVDPMCKVGNEKLKEAARLGKQVNQVKLASAGPTPAVRG